MKSVFYSTCWLCVMLLLFVSQDCTGQSQAVKQLQLDIEKLAQLKAMLSNMYQGYSVLSNGYSSIKSEAKAGFVLHKDFIDGLFLISPAVKNAPAIASIIATQASIVAEYKSGLQQIKNSGLLNLSEVSALAKQYAAILKHCSLSLDVLQMVITAGKLQMSEAERLQILGSLVTDLDKQLLSIRNFTSEASRLMALRQKLKKDNRFLQNTYGIAK
jgi:hypothetical protein